MRKQIILFIAALMSIGAMAQGHMKFKGIEMTGTPQEFAQKLKAQGLTYVTTIGNSLVLNGSFAGEANCNIYIALDGNVVSSVGVYSENYDTWSALYSLWDSWRKMLTQKYGQPVSNVEKWTIGHEPSSDSSKMMWLAEGAAKFETGFIVDGVGAIKCYITHTKSGDFVSLSYVDYQNFDIRNGSAIDDL